MPEERRVPVVLLGLGKVGRALLKQILRTRETLAQRTALRVVPVALADTGASLFDPEGIAEETLLAALQVKQNGHCLDAVAGSGNPSRVDDALREGVVLVDLTASSETEPTLTAALRASCGIVLANKIPLAGSYTRAQPLLDHPRVRYEVTVGAGLPVISTLRCLQDTGDRVTSIEGCLSGTLGYLCAELELGIPYHSAVAQARSLGYTEPDPREDLGGRDVARKALILGRTAGWPLEPNALTVEPMYSESLASVALEEFLASMDQLDESYALRAEEARAKGEVLRYVARVRPEGGYVGLMAVPKDGPLGVLRGPANYIALHTSRYNDVPLILSGPGAGPEVTAAGVYGDIIDLARQMT